MDGVKNQVSTEICVNPRGLPCLHWVNFMMHAGPGVGEANISRATTTLLVEYITQRRRRSNDIDHDAYRLLVDLAAVTSAAVP